MSSAWPALPYAAWEPTCTTLHAHSQLLGKIAVALAPPEPQLQHAALRLTPRGWETAPLPAPDGSGALVGVLDLHANETRLEHSDGRTTGAPLAPDRPVGDVTREVLAALTGLVGPVEVNLTPQEVPWTAPLDEDVAHATYDPEAVGRYLAAATRAALALARFRAPFRGRATPVNAWWGSFDLAVNLFSGRESAPPSADFIMRNAMDAEEVALGWWPGSAAYPAAAFYGYAHPAPAGFAGADLGVPGARWEDAVGEYLLDWDTVVAHPEPERLVLDFARSLFRHACVVCGWDPALLGSAEGSPPPVR